MVPLFVFSYNFLYPALLVVLFWLAFPSVSLFLVCFLGVIHMSQPVAGWFHTQGVCTYKQLVNKLKIPGSLHTIVSLVEWNSFKGRSPQWFTVRKTTSFTKMPLKCHDIWPCDFTDVTAFSSLFFLAVHYYFFLYIFFLLWLFLWLFNLLPSSFS